MNEEEAFREVDDSILTLVVHLVRAVAAMFSAFLVAQVAFDLLAIDPDRLVLRALVFAPFGAVAIFLASAIPIRLAVRIQRATIADREEQLRRESGRHQFVAALQDALEMAEDEEDGLVVVSHALGEITDQPSELLLADSSRSHLRRTIVHAPGAVAPGCTVEAPWTCPAVRRGQTLTFASSETLGACPRLRDRPHFGGNCSATCIPVTVLGTPMGVVHVIGEEHAPLDETKVALLESLARQAGSRIGVLRAMASTELQAATDPLTGLCNRRRLEAEVRRLRDRETPYAVVAADLDHFKALNDTYGHETGDRALRVFARVLQSVVREHDVVCRYGGEEFVLVLPECDAAAALRVVERARVELIGLLANGDVPGFTSSYGIAFSDQAASFEAALRLADEALFCAKQQGRNRVLVSSQPECDVNEGSHEGRVVS